MNKNLLAGLTFVFFTICSAFATPLECIRADIPPLVDGKLDEACWQKAPVYSDFTIMDTDKKATRRTELRIAYTNVAILFAFKAYIPASALPSEVEAKKNHAFLSDCVEVMLDPTGGQDYYFHFIVNCFNMRFDRYCEQGGYIGNSQWFTDWKSAVRREKDFWSAEIEVPYYCLELEKALPFWKINAVRESYNLPGGTAEISSIAINGATNIAGKFLRLTTPDVRFNDYFVGADAPVFSGKVADNQFLATGSTLVKNLDKTGKNFKLELELADTDGNPVKTFADVQIPAQASSRVIFAPLALQKQGLYKGRLTLRNPRNNRVLVKHFFDYDAKFVPIKITMIDPHYRNCIFFTQKLDKVRYNIEVKLETEQLDKTKIISGIRLPDQKTVLLQKSCRAEAITQFEFPVDGLPDGRLEVFAELLDKEGKIAVKTMDTIRKLPYRKNEVWRGKDMNWYVDGKKFFILASWAGCNVSHVPEFSVIMGFDRQGDWLRFSPLGFGYGKYEKNLKSGNLTPEVLEFFRKRVQDFSQKDNLFAHYWLDEPAGSGVSTETCLAITEIAREEDPYHPVVISTGRGGLISYVECGEINGFHCYPNPEPGKPMSNFMMIVNLMDKAKAFFAESPVKQSITYLHQGFDYANAGSLNSRIPSYEEYRNQDIMALTLGSIGLLHYNMREQLYPELYLGIPELVKEQKLIGEQAIIQPDATVKPEASNKNLRMLGKANEDSSFWLIAANASEDSADIEIRWPVMGNREFTVLSEDRSIQPKDGVFKESFTPFQARVFTDAKNLPKLNSVAEINAMIEAEYAKRAKPGNLAWQRWEESVLTVNVSSKNKFNSSNRLNATAWLLTDGVSSGMVDKSPWGYIRSVGTYCDTTPNLLPDWIELEFHKPITAGRVVVYPFEDSLRDYEIQVKKDGVYVTVAAVKDAKGIAQTHTFPPVETNAVRLYVTANNGSNTWLYEIEVFEK